MYLKQIQDNNLKDFLGYSKNLTKLYQVNRSDYDENWIEVKSSIANSVLSLYKFSDSLFKDEKFDNSKENIRFYAFYFDLILLKLKHSFFTETPKKSYVDIHTYTATTEDIALLGEELLHYKKIDDEFEIDFQRFVFKIFLMYDFIFDGDSGVFTRFELNKDLYIKIEDKIFQFEEKESLKEYGKSIILNILDTTLEFNSKECFSSSKVYSSFVNESKNNIVLLEPLSYYLGFKIWKFAKIIQSTYEFVNVSDMENEKKIFRKKFKNYLLTTKKIINDFYTQKITNRELFLLMGKADKEIITDALFSSILPKYEKNKISLEKYTYEKFVIKTDKIKDYKNIINTMIDNNEYDRFKFYRILEDSSITIKDISYLVSLVYTLLPKDANYELVGMLRSGVLLAHCINVTKNRNKLIYMFSSFPYISLLPRTYLSDNQNVIFIDESIKSAFSTTLANIYKQRTLWLNDGYIYNYSASVVALVDFKNFKKEGCDIPFKNLAVLNAVNGNIVLEKEATLEEDIKEIFNWRGYFESLDDFKLKFEDILVTVDGVERLDITRLLVDSTKLFKIAKMFAKHIESNIEDNEVILYASTDEGKLFVDATILTYKALYKNKKCFTLHKKKANQMFKENSVKLVFVDISIDTMHTIERSLKLDFETDVESLSLALSILASKTARTKLDDKVYYIDKLHKDEE